MIGIGQIHFASGLCRSSLLGRTTMALLLFLALLATGALHAVPPPAHAGEQAWKQAGSIVNECGVALSAGPGQGAACMLGSGLNLLIDEGMLFANQTGKEVFGEHFQVAGSLGWSSASFGTGWSGFEADLDVIAPLTAFGPADKGARVSSLFFQQGITRWWDSSGSARNDLRYGVAHRFRVASAPDADIVGISAFVQHSLELGHQVVVPSVDYIGRWGAGSFRWFVPTTGWRPVHAGRAERALEGMELGLRLELTTTVDLKGTAYQWEAEDGSGRDIRGGRAGLNWHPHPWLKFDAGYDDAPEGDDAAFLGMRLAVPLGAMSRRPHWSGLGLAAGGKGPSSEQLWQPVEEVGQIHVAVRDSLAPAADTEVSARFVEDDFGSGETVDVEVSLSVPASEDIEVIVRLVPGTGANPAIPGEDFVDEPVTATIRGGTKSTIVSIPLLLNESMEQPRSLDVTATLAS